IFVLSLHTEGGMGCFLNGSEREPMCLSTGASRKSAAAEPTVFLLPYIFTAGNVEPSIFYHCEPDGAP
ncbi:hypothetical protein DD595_26360, partial [Enterobacter cloacae complex sp. 4DZ3-17B2]|uniref:hypothetical protein n=1 Tax=Enterobacter cloacae complex sp. 4DZ3-17B2 TaxID=2511990 RepID=UPI00102647B3